MHSVADFELSIPPSGALMPLPMFPDAATPRHTPKQHFIDLFEREHATTVRVLGAYPADQARFQPNERCASARDVAWTIARGNALMAKALTTGFDWSAPSSTFPAPPDSVADILTELEREHQRTLTILRETPDERLAETVKFFVAPKTLG